MYRLRMAVFPSSETVTAKGPAAIFMIFTGTGEGIRSMAPHAAAATARSTYTIFLISLRILPMLLFVRPELLFMHLTVLSSFP